MHVHNVLTVKGSAVATITPESSLADATAALRDHGVGALVVSRDGSAIDGIISERDVVRALGNDTVDQMMAMMTERRIRHLPVVDDDGLLAGIISIGDVVKAHVGQLELENDQLHDYIQAR